jgi:hypothetical protein
LKSTRQPNVTQ